MSETPTITPVEVVDEERGGLPSASSMKRTRRCPGWLNLSKTIPKQEGGADADTGTSRHGMIELEIDPDTVDDKNEAYVLAQSARLREKALREAGFDPETVQAEKEVRYWVHDEHMQAVCSARLDYLAIGEDHGLIVDYKTLFGNHASAHQNEQLACQAVAAAEVHDFNRVRVALIQPNLETAKQLTQAEFTRSDLVYARAEVLRWSYAAMEPNAPRIPGPVQCDNCPCRAYCPEAMAAGFTITLSAQYAVDTPENMAWLLDRAELATKVVKSIREKAKRMIEAGTVIPGWKITPGDTKRTITQPTVAFSIVANAGANADELSACATVKISELDKLYYKKRKAADGLTAVKAKEELEQKLLAAGALEKKQNAASLEKDA